MNILFLCGSLQVGHDGVGDYSRRLSGALIKKGHQVQILSLCDNQSRSLIYEKQTIDGIVIEVNRIPLSTTYQKRVIWTADIVNKFQPDLISLQFVPYSFNPKGLPFWLPFFLKKLKGNHQWHVMFHELWIGMDVDASFKSKVIGFLQKGIVLNILKRNKSIIIHTQTDLYKNKIARLGYTVQLLPLFSNITNHSDSVAIPSKEMELKFCFFGSMHYGAPVAKFIDSLQQALLVSNDKRALKFIFIGNCGVGIEEWKQVLVSNNIKFEITGFVSDSAISSLLSSCQYGISTTPYVLCQKSGTVAAMLNHQLPVLCVARKWSVQGYIQGPFLNVIEYENIDTIKDFLNRTFILSNNSSLEFVASTFLNGLH